MDHGGGIFIVRSFREIVAKGAQTEADARTEPTARRQWIFAELVDEISGTGEIFPECVCDNPRAG